MDDPVRLLEGDARREERELLEAGRREEPPPGATSRALVALGVGSGLVSAAGTAAAATAASAASTSGTGGAATAAAGLVGGGSAAGAGAGSGAMGTTVTTLAIAKWFGAGLVGGTLALGTAAGVGELVSSEAPAGGAERASEAPTAAGGRAAPAATPTLRSAPAEAALVPPSPEDAVEPRPADGPSIADEVVLLDEARAAIGHGDVSTARAALREHEQRFPAGELRPEAQVLRIEVTLGAGRHAEAAVLAGAFLAAQGDSPHADKVRRLLARARDQGSRAPTKRRSDPTTVTAPPSARAVSAPVPIAASAAGDTNAAAPSSGNVGRLPPVE